MQETLAQTNPLKPWPLEAAPWDRVAFAAPPAWVEGEDYDATLRSKEGSHVTQLLWSRQVEADAGASFHASALRLETALAVQHESQWSLDLDGRSARVTLHWLRVVREGKRIDQLKRERMRLIQRETQLERHVIDGSWTLLIVLEDVRPGDVIEAAYTYEGAHPIRPEGCEVFFVVPPHATVGRYRLTVQSAASRAGLRWKSSDDAPAPREERTQDGGRRLIWEGAQLTPRDPEPNQPSGYLDYIWVQVSDLANWAELAARVDVAWSARNEVAGLAETEAFAKPERVNAAAILGLIRHVQDAFRYLSVNLETSGWIPSAPGEVARRRHGDCKDLVWLAATVLRGWGVKARPVLVGTGLRGRVDRLLPMAMLFNHAILEVEWNGDARWFDLTARDQGGDYDTQAVEWFGLGLVADGAQGDLRPQPGRRSPASYALKETILLDTARQGVSLVELRLRAEGWQADHLRRARLARGPEAFSKDRDEQASRRYGRAKRSGELQWRDSRTRNVCELVEVFELIDAVYPGEKNLRALFDAPPNLVAQTFALPEDKPRRAPWDMPYPLEIAHEVTIKSLSLSHGAGPRRRWLEPEFEAVFEGLRIRGAWTNRTRFRVCAPEVSTERLPAYRKSIEELFRELGWRLYLPWGQPRSRRGDGFGELGEEDEELVAGASLVTIENKAPAVARGVDTAESAKIGGGQLRRRKRVSQSGGRRAGEAQITLPTKLNGLVIRLGLLVVFLIAMAILHNWLRSD